MTTTTSLGGKTVIYDYAGVISGAVCSDEGWPIVEVERRNDDPHVCDDNWHRGPYTVMTLPGTGIREEERTYDGIGDLFDRVMAAIVATGYRGFVVVVNGGFRQLTDAKSYA